MQELQQRPNLSDSQDLSLWDDENPRAVINLLTPEFASKVKEHRQSHPEYFGLDERALAFKLKAERMMPSPTVNRMRMQFWVEYDLAQSTNKKMRMNQIYRGLCAVETWRNFQATPQAMAWILTPPMNYVTIMNEALNFGVEQLRDLLELEHFNKETGKVDVRVAELKMKIIWMLDQRVNGAVTQKIEQTNKNMNLNVTTTDKQVVALARQHSAEELQHMLKRINKQASKLEAQYQQPADPNTIEVKAESVE